MTAIIYVVTVRGLVPTDLSRKVIEAHTKALTLAQRQKQSNKSKDGFRYQLAASRSDFQFPKVQI
jgi:hypothetical protein